MFRDFLGKHLDTHSPFYRLIITLRLGRPAGWIHGALIRTQLGLIHAFSRSHPDFPDHSLDSQLTIIIKTFERPQMARRLIKSVRVFYPSIPIIVADDSRHPLAYTGAETIALPYDSGSGAGRAAALSRVKTRYFLNLDDDFVFHRGINLRAAVAAMEQNRSIDIMGGWLINLPFFRMSGPGGKIFLAHGSPPAYTDERIGSFKRYNKVPQFFIGVTERVAAVGWDSRFKAVDHGTFFGRALGKLRVVFNPKMSVLHARTPFNQKHTGNRRKRRDDWKLVAKLYPIVSY